MARRAQRAATPFEALTIEGALIAPAMLAKVALREAGGQTEADYGTPKGLTLRDEIARYFRIGQALFGDLAKAAAPSSSATVKFTEALLRDVFGFTDFHRPGTRALHGRDYVLTLEALGGRVPIVVVPPSDDLDRASDHLPVDGRRRSAASAIQDWLNANTDALWGLCCNGERLRLVRGNASLTRPAYIDADLRQIFEADGFADFAALWLLIHASRFGASGSPAADCALERWRDAGAKEGLVVRDRLRDGVEAALLALGSGFLTENPALREQLQKGELSLPEYFGQLLRLIYRLIFLLVVEERGLLHAPNAPTMARRLYADGYSLSTLRERAIRRAAWDRHHDRWEGLLVTFAALAHGEPCLGLPALGGLFLPELMPDLGQARLSNRALMEAVYRLAWMRDEASLVPVNWRDMETEELGSVYESLLELTPRIADDGRGFVFAEGIETGGHARKTTSSYYTPDSLVQALLNSALDPVLDRVEMEAEDAAKALLGVTVIDPACGSGHFLLAAARRIATRLARARAGGVASAEDFRHALRDVARNCIHGVDRNPMAVELTKVALWIETVEPGKPLGFLDANVRCGDALLGVFDLDALRQGIPNEAYSSLSGDDKETAKHFAARNRAEKRGQGALDFGNGGGSLPAPPPLAETTRALRALPEDSVEQIAEKKKRLAATQADPTRWHWRVAADLYVSAFLVPKIGGTPDSRNSVMIPTTAHVWQALAGSSVDSALVDRAQNLAEASRAFHWPLEFADVMAGGGFDAVLGNPPWDVIQLVEEEYFAQRLPEIAELEGVARKNAIAALEKEHPSIFATYLKDKRLFEASNEFARASGRFNLTARGKINTYALFAELFLSLMGPRARAGVIVQTGIATDAMRAPFFAALVDGKRLATLFDFENRDAIFPAVHRSYKFSLLTIGRDVKEAGFAFFLTDVAQLTDTERRFTLSPTDIARMNPNTKTAPVFRARADAELTAKIYSRVPVLAPQTGPGSFALEMVQNFFSTSNKVDAQLFADAAAAGPTSEILPVLRGTMIDQFDHRAATYEAEAELFRAPTLAELRSPNFVATSDKRVAKEKVLERLAERGWRFGWMMGWRDICRSTDERTVIGAAFPVAGTDDTLSLLFPLEGAVPGCALLANLNALVLDYVAQQKVGGTHIRKYVISQFPVLPFSSYTRADLDFLTLRVLELTYTSHSMAPFARDLGYDGQPFGWIEDRRALLRAELDAFYARAYGLTRDELRYILDPADVRGPDYPSETFRVLKNNEIGRYGEYRTARLVLDAWDRMERGELS